MPSDLREAQECRVWEMELADKKKALDEKIEKARKSLYACCQEDRAPANICDAKCAAEGKKTLKRLEAEKNRLETSINPACIPESRTGLKKK